jgi:hypothetical protein
MDGANPPITEHMPRSSSSQQKNDVVAIEVLNGLPCHAEVLVWSTTAHRQYVRPSSYIRALEYGGIGFDSGHMLGTQGNDLDLLGFDT